MQPDLWPGLDLRHLAAFTAVARAQSFARAARELGYTQPAVSQQVAALEKIVGQRLFDRASGRADATLTEAGEVLLAHVEAVAARLAAARQDLAALACGDAGTLRVGAFQSASASILPRVLARYADEWPGVRVELEETTGDETLLGAVATGELDFAFALLPIDDEALECRELVRDEFVLVARAGRRIASLAELAGEPLIVYRTCRSAALLLAHVEAHAGPANVVFRSDDNSAIKELVRSGIGMAILPELWTRLGGNEGLELTPLAGLVPPRTVALAWRRDRELTAAQASFVEVAAAASKPRASLAA